MQIESPTFGTAVMSVDSGTVVGGGGGGSSSDSDGLTLLVSARGRHGSERPALRRPTAPVRRALPASATPFPSTGAPRHADTDS